MSRPGQAGANTISIGQSALETRTISGVVAVPAQQATRPVSIKPSSSR